jgi:hypothetical protein
MFDLISINRLLNCISILVYFASSIVVITKHTNYMDILAFIYLISFMPFYCYGILKKDKINNKILMKNGYYYLCGFILFNFGMFFICLNKYTLGSGLFLVFLSIYNILMGVFQESSDYKLLDPNNIDEENT